MPKRIIKSQAPENPTSREFFSLGGRHEDKAPEDLGRRKKDPTRGPRDSSFLHLKTRRECPLRSKTFLWAQKARVPPESRRYCFPAPESRVRRSLLSSLKGSAPAQGIPGGCVVHCPGHADSVSLSAPSDICSYRGQRRARSETGAASGRSGT